MLLTEQKKHGRNRGTYITIILFVLIALAFVFALNSVSGKTQQQQAAFLENTIHRAVIACFAIEGRYPPSLEYLAENYGVQTVLDNDQYIVSYKAFASNIFPDIAVLRVGVE